MTNQTTDSHNEYMNIITKARAYLNRVRRVTPDRGEPFYSVTAACMYGKITDGVKLDLTYIDTIVVGSEAIQRVKRLLELEGQSGERELTIKASVEIGDIRSNAFIYTSGKNQGNPGANIKGRLLKIDKVDVNGERIDFGDESDDTPANDASASQPEQAAGRDESPATDDQLTNQKPDVLKLDFNDPNYQAVAQQMMDDGYQLDPISQEWKLVA